MVIAGSQKKAELQAVCSQALQECPMSRAAPGSLQVSQSKMPPFIEINTFLLDISQIIRYELHSLV